MNVQDKNKSGHGNRAWCRAGRGLFLSAGLALRVSLAAAEPQTLLPPMNGEAADFAPRRAGAEAGASIKLTVAGGGICRLTQTALVAAGVDPLVLEGAQMRLFGGTQEVAVYVSSEGVWTADDYLIFYAKPFEGLYSDAMAYWLGFGPDGRRMGQRVGTPFVETPDTISSPWRIRFRNFTFLQDKHLPDDDWFDHWFTRVLGESWTTRVQLPSPRRVASEPARLTIELFGRSSVDAVQPDHLTRVWFNGRKMPAFKFDGQQAVTGTRLIDGAELKSPNVVKFRQILQPGVTMDRVYLREMKLDYTRHLWAVNGALVFAGQTGARNYRVKGFPDGPPFWLLDVTDPDAPVLLTDPEVFAVDNRTDLRFGDEGETVRRYAVGAALRLKTPVRIENVSFPGLDDPARQADYLVICPPGFRTQAARLVDRRAAQGLTGLVVSVPDIYNTFGYGVVDAAAIKQFLGYAYHHWQPPAPRYVLLAGAGSYDPKGYLFDQRGFKSFVRAERIPLRMGPSLLGWASLDGWYAQVDGADNKVDMALGRLPVHGVAPFRRMVDKIIAFEEVRKLHWRRTESLLVAGKADASINGKAVNEAIRTNILAPAGYASTTAYVGDVGEPMARETVRQSLRAGVQLACYFGHGGMDRWGRNLLTSADAPTLDNAHYPVFLMLACRNGALQNPLDGRSLAEALLHAPGGASACIATTTISFGSSSRVFAMGFLRELVTNQARRLGDGFLAGLTDLHTHNPATQELLYLNLFGDPAMVFNPE